MQARRDAYRRRKKLDAPGPSLGAAARPRGVQHGCAVCGRELARPDEVTCSAAHRRTLSRWRRKWRQAQAQ